MFTLYHCTLEVCNLFPEIIEFALHLRRDFGHLNTDGTVKDYGTFEVRLNSFCFEFMGVRDEMYWFKSDLVEIQGDKEECTCGYQPSLDWICL